MMNSEFFFELQKNVLDKNITLSEFKGKIKKYPLIENITKKNVYSSKEDMLQSSEATSFYIIDDSFLECDNLDSLSIYIKKEYDIEIDSSCLKKLIIGNLYDNNLYLDWNLFNLLIILLNKKFTENEICSYILDYDGELIESYILNYNLYIDFKDLNSFNINFIKSYIKELNSKDSMKIKQEIFNIYNINNLKEKNKLFDINSVKPKASKIEYYNRQISYNNILNNKEFSFIENSKDLKYWSNFFKNCIYSNENKIKLKNNEFFLIVNEKEKICFSVSNEKQILELKGVNNQEVTDENILNKVKIFINENI